MNKLWLPGFFVLALSGCNGVRAEPSPATPPAAPDAPAAGMDVAPPPALSQDDAGFLATATTIARAEMEAAQVAVVRSRTGAIREFAQTLVQEHEKNVRRLRGIADRGLAPDAPLDAMQAHMLAELREAPDASFDRRYLSTAIRAHMDALASLQQMVSDSRSAELKAYAGESLISTRAHLAQARKLETQLVARASPRA